MSRIGLGLLLSLLGLPVSQAVAHSQVDSVWLSWGCMPAGSGRYDHMTVGDDTSIYVLGGFFQSQVRRGFYRAGFESHAWESLPEMPIGIATGGAAILGDTIYVASGYAETGLCIDTLLKYSLSGRNWTTGIGPYFLQETTFSYSPKLVACQGRLYHIGGSHYPSTAWATNRVRVYTPGSVFGWQDAARMHWARTFAACGVYHDTIWVAGGVDDSRICAHTEFYVPEIDRWIIDSCVFPRLPGVVGGAASGVAGDRFFVYGGKDTSYRRCCDVFDFATGRWLPRMPTPAPSFRGSGCGLSSGIAFVSGGRDERGDCYWCQFPCGLEKHEPTGAVTGECPMFVIPNPVKRSARINIGPQRGLVTSIMVQDVTGRTVMSKAVSRTPSRDGAVVEIDVSSLPAGCYFVVLHFPPCSGRVRFIKLDTTHPRSTP